MLQILAQYLDFLASCHKTLYASLCSTKHKGNNEWCYGKVLAFLQSLGNAFQILATMYAKMFCPNFIFILGALDLNWNYESFC